MKGKKNPIIMGLVGAMLLSTGAFAATPSDFSDFPTDWSAPAMTRAVENGLLNGSDGKILPKGLLTRAQMATMVNRAFASSAKASLTNFTDMVPGAWHYDEMAKAVQMGVFQGADGKLSPNDPITREQAFAVLARAFGLADGKTSSLDQFSDGAQVSSWAKGAVAALVEQGYVKGADGALNPQSYITRAEFAQVMDALVAAYADKDLKDQTVEGNLILRTNSTLENVTVNGDLILSDGVSTASLKNVTVTGRIVVRGGSDKIALTKTTAKNGIQLANPNGKPNVTVDGKTYDPNGSNNGGSTSGGSTSGGSSSGGSSSSSGGNSSSKDTIVKANQTQVITTDAGTWLPLVFEAGYNKDNTTVTVDGQNVTNYVTNVTTEGTIAKLPLVGTPGTVTLTSGNTTQTIVVNQKAPATSAVYTEKTGYLPDYYLAHGPLALWDYYLTNYDDAGNARVLPKQTTFSTTPAKNEHPSYSPVTVLNEGNTSGDVVIMFNYKNSAAKDGDEAWFDNIAEQGALELVQYDQYKSVLNSRLIYNKGTTDHDGTVGTLTIPFNQTNFTSNGRYYVRVASTTADDKKSYALVPIHVVNHDAPEFAVRETPESGRNLHFSVKNMVYGIVDPIEEVTLTKPDKTTVTLNKIDDYFLFSQDLFVLYNDVNAEHGTNHLNQKGNYVLTIKANGFRDATCKFYVNNGEEVETPAAKAMRSYGIDVLSGATTSIGGSDSSSGGGYAVSADLLFDSDLLANALVLEQVKAETPAAITVLDYWKSNTTHDAVFNKGDTKYYPIGAYTSAVNNAQAEGTMWIPFASYRTNAKATASQPHATKAVLEDGLLGEIQDSSTSGKLDFVEAVVSNNQQGKDVVLTFSGDDATTYLTKIKENGLVYLNGDWRELGTDKYTVDLDENTITFNANCFTIGKNTIRLKSAGYKVQDVEVNYAKVNETDLSLTATVDENTAGKVQIVINNSNGDFLKNLNAITLGERNVWPKGVSSADDVYYVVAEDYKSVDLYNVTTPGQYTVNIKANYYEEAGLSAEFTVAGTVELKPVPNTKPTVTIDNKNYLLTFGSTRDIKDWNSAVNSVTVNGVTYTKFDAYFGNISQGQYKVESDIGGQGVVGILLHNSQFTKDTDNEIVIKATGYEDLTLSVNKDGTVPGDVTVKAAPTVTAIESKGGTGPFDTAYYSVTLQAAEGESLDEYFELAKQDTVTVVTVNGQRYTRNVTNISMNSYYQFTVFSKVLDLTKDGFNTNGNTTVTVEVPGYEMLTFIVDKGGNLVTDSNPGENPGGGNTGENPGEGEIKAPTTAPAIEYTQATSGSYNYYYKLTFQGNDSAWINTITAVSVNGTPYTKKGSAGELGPSQNYYLDSENSIVGINLNSFYSPCEVVFSVNGKASLTLTVTIPFGEDPSVTIKQTETPSGGESGGGTGAEDASVPNTVNISEEKLSSGTDYQKLTFGGSGAWLNKVVRVEVDGKPYDESNSIDTKKWDKDVANNTVSIKFPSELWSTTYTVVFMTAENKTLLTLQVIMPALSGTPTVKII